MAFLTVTEEELLAQGYRKYTGEKVDIYYNHNICEHVSNCVRGNPQVFEVGRKPWILSDNGEAQEVMRVVNTCTTGALKYVYKGENEMEFRLEENRFALLDGDKEIGEMTWSLGDSQIMIIDHTFVDPGYRGQGLAEQLVAHGVAFAREHHYQVIPLCPFAKKEFSQKSEYQDVLRK